MSLNRPPISPMSLNRPPLPSGSNVPPMSLNRPPLPGTENTPNVARSTYVTNINDISGLRNLIRGREMPPEFNEEQIQPLSSTLRYNTGAVSSSMSSMGSVGDVLVVNGVSYDKSRVQKGNTGRNSNNYKVEDLKVIARHLGVPRTVTKKDELVDEILFRWGTR
jgi:hypothetical protein